jgi:hypothetical protein
MNSSKNKNKKNLQKKIILYGILLLGLFFLFPYNFISFAQTLPEFTVQFQNSTYTVNSSSDDDNSQLTYAKSIYSYIENNLSKFHNKLTYSKDGNITNIGIITGRYQEIQNLKKDNVIGVQTGFDLGYNFAKAYKEVNGTEALSITTKCNNTTLYFSDLGNPSTLLPADEISNDKNNSNGNVIFYLFQCLEFIDEDKTIDDYEGVNKVNIEQLLSEATANTHNLSYKGADKVITLPLMFMLGKEFYLSGGKIHYPGTNPNQSSGNNNTSGQGANDENDPCKNYNLFESKGNLIPHLEFDGEPFYLVPEAPGTLDWKNLTLTNFLGGARGDDSSIQRECLTGPGVIMAIIWKVVTFFENLLGIIALAMLVYGGYLYLVSGGEEDLAQKATKSLTWSVVGIVIVITSRLLTEILIPRYNNTVFYNQEKILTADSANIGLTSIIGITNWVLGFVASITVLMIIYGGYLYIVSGGDENLEKKGKDILIEAIIGLIIIITAYTLVSSIFGAANAG